MNKKIDAIKKNKEDTKKSVDNQIKSSATYGNARLNTILLVHEAIDKGYIKLEYSDKDGNNKKTLDELEVIGNEHIRYFKKEYTQKYLGVTWTTKTHKNQLDALGDALSNAIGMWKEKSLAEYKGKHLDGKKGDKLWVDSKFVTNNNPSLNPNKAKGKMVLSFSQLDETCRNYFSRQGKGSGVTATIKLDPQIDKLNTALVNDMEDKTNPFLKSTVKTIDRLMALSTTLSNYIRKKTLSEGSEDTLEDRNKIEEQPKEEQSSVSVSS